MKTASSLTLGWMQKTLVEFVAQVAMTKSLPTVEAYKYDVANFLNWLAGGGKVRRVSSLRAQHIMAYLQHCKEAGKSDASLNRYYMSIRSYCRFLRRSKVLESDLTEDMSAPRMQQKAPNIPSEEDIGKILRQPNTCTESGARDRAILELLYSSGLRASELCALRVGNVTPNSITVENGKRGKTRTVPITRDAWDAISCYMREFRDGARANEWLFTTRLGRQIRRQLLCAVVAHYAKRAGVEEVTTHTLRHACATHLHRAGADVRFIQEVLGHASIASTQRYTHLSSASMQDMFAQYHPRKKEVV